MLMGNYILSFELNIANGMHAEHTAVLTDPGKDRILLRTTFIAKSSY